MEIEHTHAEDMADYVAATITKPLPRVAEKERPPSTDPERQNSDSDSSGWTKSAAASYYVEKHGDE